jgi:beta-phosphoglucomutase-like phosphatase (HAD superfamily)
MVKKLDLKKIKAFILDMDGVLIDSEPIHVEAFRDYLNKNHISYTEELLRSFIGNSVEDNIRKIQESIPGRDRRPIREGVTERNRIYLERLRNHELMTMSGIDDIIQYCIERNKFIGLATSSPAEQVDAVLSTIQGAYAGKYEQIFHATVNGQEVEHKKPAPDIYYLICKKLGVNGHHAVSVEDSPAGVESARRAGLLTIGITSRYYDENDLTSADIIVDSAREIMTLLQ